MLAPFAMAQEPDAPNTDKTTTTKTDEQMTEILVTGIRKALQTSQEIKKDADTVVDSITATDIGAFPDKSVAEALQRMTGVTVTRFAASGDTSHFSAEPSGVVVRGLPQVRSEFNGRDSFNANSSRGLSFGDVSPELMAGVDTYKNATADMIEGGIAGTVNLRTHVPFDSEGFVAAFSAEMGYGTLAEEAKPAGSLLISNRWDTGIGEFGFMANAAYSDVVTESQGVQLTRFFNATNVAAYGGGTKWIPGGIDIRDNVYDRTRKGMSLAGQYRSPEEAVLLTLQYNHSEYQNDWEEYSLSAGVGNSQQPQGLVLNNQFSRNPTGTPAYEFDSRGVFVRGIINDVADGWAGPTNNPTIAHPDGYRQGGANNSPDWVCYTWGGSTNKPCPNTRGAGLGADTRYSTQTNLTKDYSANLRWNVSERFGLNFDIQYVDSSVDNFDNSSNNKTATNLELDISGGKPRFAFHQPTGYGMDGGRLRGSAELVPRMDDGTRGEQHRRRARRAYRCGHPHRIRLDRLPARRCARRGARSGGELDDLQLGFGAATLGPAKRCPVLPQPGSLAEHLGAERPGFRTWSVVACSTAARSCIRITRSSATTTALARCTATAAATAGSHWPIAAAR